MCVIFHSVVEQPHAGEGHDHAVFVGGLDDIVVPDAAARLRHIADAGFSGPLDVVAEGEEGVGAQGHAVQTRQPEVLTLDEKKAWIAQNTKVALGSDAFFPFGDNIERAHKSGVEFIAQAGGSVRDDHVIMTCDKYGIAMAFTGVRLFHH